MVRDREVAGRSRITAEVYQRCYQMGFACTTDQLESAPSGIEPGTSDLAEKFERQLSEHRCTPFLLL